MDGYRTMPSASSKGAATCVATPPGRMDSASVKIRALRQLGFTVLLQRGDCGLLAPGIGIRLSVDAIDACNLSRHWEFSRIRALLFERCPVTLTLCDVSAQNGRQLERLLRHLHRASSAPCIDRRQLGVALPDSGFPLPAYLLMSRIWLGNGPRYVILEDNNRKTAADRAAQRALFSTLYQQRLRQRTLEATYGLALRSRCALLPDETGTSISAPLALVGPPDSAWLPLKLNLCRYCDSRGRLHEAELHDALRSGLRIADALFDQLYWPDSRQRSDARENRRIAFLVEGIGDLVVLRRDNPSSIACLRRLDRLLAGIHASLWDESGRLAKKRGLLPALSARNPLLHLPAGAARQNWRDRWQDALAHTAVRHRNLLVLSPYALLPHNGATDPEFTDLLPLLAYADALSFADRPSFAGWCLDEFRAFHLRAAAVLRRRNAASFIATGV